MARDDDGAAVGFAFVSPAPLSSDWDRPAVYVEDIAVAPGARGGGIGSRLLAAVREHAGDREVRLSVLAANHDARRFYAREGFVEFIHQLVPRPARAVSPPQPARDGSLPSQGRQPRIEVEVHARPRDAALGGPHGDPVDAQGDRAARALDLVRVTGHRARRRWRPVVDAGTSAARRVATASAA